jgi:hypothetical protein
VIQRKPFYFWARTASRPLSAALSGGYSPDMDRRKDRIILRVDDWTVAVDLHQQHDSGRIFTRIHAPYISVEGFRFKVYHGELAEEIANLPGAKGAPCRSLEDIEVGGQVLGDLLVVKATDPVEIRRLLSNRKISRGLETEPSVLLYAEHFELYPEDVDVLTLEVPEHAVTLSRLRRIIELFSEVLHAMCHMGAAYEDDPNIILNY